MIADFLKIKKWAVVGATDKEEKFGFKILKTLLKTGYEVVPINPNLSIILGEKCYKTLSEAKNEKEIEAVNLVVPPQVAQKVLLECHALGIKNVWLQPGVNTKEVIQLAKNLGLNCISDACIMVEAKLSAKQ